jgi:hypothetical protein
MDYAYWWAIQENPAIKAEMAANPKLFICGHSHILKVMFDKKHNLLHMNGLAEKKWVSSGTHHVAVCNRGDKIKDLEIV